MLALLAKAEFPKAPVDLQIQVGWLALLALTLTALWAWTRAESVRRSIFAREDPRMFALFRIGLGVITIQNFWNLLMHWRMLWTDEGMFTHDETLARLGRPALVGWSEQTGFFDGWAVLKFFWGKFSLLYFDSSPEFVQLYLVIMFGALALYTIGFRTRVTGWLSLLLIFSLYNRNAVYLEGHDTVFKCLWFATVFARTDAAWSVDNWIRRRREAAYRARVERGIVPFDLWRFVDLAGHWLWGGLWAWLFCAKVDFTTRHVNLVIVAGLLIAFLTCWIARERLRALAARGPLALPEPARFQLIPAWPRYIIIAQLVCIYWATGLYKTGSVWKSGDALYYSLNMDHFYRFEGFTQWISVYLATNVFKVMSLVTWWWEKLFPLVVIGLILEFGLRHRESAWYRAQDAVLWRKWLGRVALLGAYLVVYRLLIVAYPWCLELQPDKTPTPAGPGMLNLHMWFGGIVPLAVVGWFVLGRWPLKLGKLVVDQKQVRAWLLGRRVWLGIGLIFHGMLIATMNIGMFPVIMMWIYVAYFEARPFLRIFRWLAALLRKSKYTTWLAPRVFDSALSEDTGVLETTEQSLGRDPTGPWWLDPWKLFVGPLLLLRSRKREALLEIEERGQTRGGTIPDALVLALGASLVILVGLRGLEAQDDPLAASNDTQFVGDVRSLGGEDKQAELKARKQRIDRLGDAARWLAYSMLAFAAVSHFRRRRPFDQVDGPARTEAVLVSMPWRPNILTTYQVTSRPAEPAIMGGTVLRTVALGFVLYHCSAVAVLFVPDYPITNAWRGELKKPFGDWVRGTNQEQSWKMFAPNPPTSNTFMRTVVIDQDGASYQVGNDHYANRPYVFWYNDRMRKMHRRMIGKSKWYLRYWGQYHCRDWAFNHDGQLPQEVRMLKLKTPIPSPEELAEAGEPSDPRKRKLRRELVETYTCTSDVITPEMKLRRGWPLTEDDQRILDSRPKRAEIEANNKRSNWDKRDDFGGKKKDEAGK
ncbi:MAG TPA: hypothetical protein VM869_07595 [Enhygromyxa sp.]|nr:hypothetical protein [Enhygromyxa sp.]